MKLTIVAATGGIGRQALDQAVTAGHQVTAVVHNPTKLAGDAVHVVTAGADAVLSGLGPRSTSQWCPARSPGSTGRATTPLRRGASWLPAQVIESQTGGRKQRRQSWAR